MLISVYLPTRNRHRPLQQAVASVLAQTHADFELIVVDDASTDATADYLETLAAGDRRVRVLHHERAQGAPACRNRAVARARGEWVTGLDDDDEFMPERLALLADYARFLTAGGVRFGGVFAQDWVRVSDRQRVRSNKRGPVAFADLFESNRIGNQVLARRTHYLDIGGFDERLPAWQDLDFLLRLVARHGPAQLLDAPLYVFDDRPRNDRISCQHKQRLLDSWRLISAKYPSLPTKWHQLLYLQAFARCYGHALTAADLWRFYRLGFDASATLRLLRRLLGREGGPADAAPPPVPGDLPLQEPP